MKSNLLAALLFLSTMNLHSNAQQNTPTQSLVTIPVVVHLLYNHASVDSINDANIIDQINILNKDFRKENADTINIPAPFKQFTLNRSLQTARIYIYNTMGQLIYQSILTSPQNTIDLTAEKRGIYIVKINDGIEGWVGKLVRE